ncbi:hypothetical protein AGMMS49523_06860 [Endomicrobiia bacterium]|nr:hypothetical protein AGMMS49523_06860 [Endomicrobiia bacterium]
MADYLFKSLIIEVDYINIFFFVTYIRHIRDKKHIYTHLYKRFIEVRIDMFFISNMPDVGDEEKDIYIINFYNKRLE